MFSGLVLLSSETLRHKVDRTGASVVPSLSTVLSSTRLRLYEWCRCQDDLLQGPPSLLSVARQIFLLKHRRPAGNLVVSFPNPRTSYRPPPRVRPETPEPTPVSVGSSNLHPGLPLVRSGNYTHRKWWEGLLGRQFSRGGMVYPTKSSHERVGESVGFEDTKEPLRRGNLEGWVEERSGGVRRSGPRVRCVQIIRSVPEKVV